MPAALTSSTDWAEEQFGSCALGNLRRTRRLVRMGAALAENPLGTLPGTFSRADELKAAYRFVENDRISRAQILAGHQTQTRQACHQAGDYLLVEDTTGLDYSGRAATGLGQIGNRRGQGLLVHSALAVRIEGWSRNLEPQVRVVGLFGQHGWCQPQPTKARHEKKRKRLSRPRESARWAAGVQETDGPPGGVRWTHVADRESDVYEAFARCRQRHVDFIVRAAQERALAQEDRSMFAAVRAAPVLGRFTLDVRARPGQAARCAEVEVRARAVTLRGPWRPGGRAEDWAVHVVEAREVAPPAGVEPILWVLLSTWACSTFAEALRVVKAYACRWLIEQFHKALKSGTHVDDSQLETAARLETLVGILSVVATRLIELKLLARVRPDEPVTPEHFGAEALAVLEQGIGRPALGWTNATVLVGIARLGGFLARKGDGPPGWQTIWRGFRRLMLMVQGYELAQVQRCG